MTARLNFLHESERRYQGPISHRFMIVTAASTIIAALIVFDLYLVFQMIYLKQTLKWSQRTWTQTEPREVRLLKLEGESKRYGKLLDEAGGWADSRLIWSEVLEELRVITPATIQLQQYEMRDELSVPRKRGGAVAGGKASKTPSAKVPIRQFKLEIAGASYGDNAEDVAVGFVRQLREAPVAGRICRQTTLQSMHKDRSRRQEEDDGKSVVFDIEAVGFERELKR